jgi:hypothetical protein
MPKTDKLYTRMLRHLQHDLPNLGADIATGHASNTPDRLARLHGVLSDIVRYLIVDGAEKHGIDLARLQVTGTGTDTAAATMPAQHYPASAPNALGSPRPMQSVNVNVGSTPLQMGGVIEPESDPEPTNVMQIITRRNGERVVIPPRTSNAPKRVFAPGENVDTMYIVAADAAANPSPSSLDPT